MREGNLAVIRALADVPTLFAIASGLALALAFPPIDWSFAAWVALIPFLVSIHGVRPSTAFRLGWVFGIVFFLSTFYWIVYVLHTYTPIPEVIAAVILILLAAVLALYSGLFAAGVAFAQSAGVLPAVFAPLCWVVVEWLRASLPVVGVPWLLLSYSQYRNLSWVQTGEIAGPYGLSALIVFANATFAAIVCNQGSRASRARLLTVLTFVLVVTFAFGMWRRADLAARKPDRHLRAAVVQANIPQDEKWEPQNRDATLDTYERLTRMAVRDRVDVIVWPESSVPFFFDAKGSRSDRVKDLVAETRRWLIFGAPGYEYTADSHPTLFNRAYLIGPDGAVQDSYDKQLLVPFGEYVPFASVLFFVDKIAEGVSFFSAGASAEPLRAGPWSAGVLICYEAIFPHLARRMVQHGADLLVNITNDAWFGKTAAPYQHFAMATFRAVENRVPLVRAANTGISAFVEPDGTVRHPTDLFVTTYRVHDLHWPAVRTFYSRFGDVFVAFCALLGAGLLIHGAGCLKLESLRR